MHQMPRLSAAPGPRAVTRHRSRLCVTASLLRPSRRQLLRPEEPSSAAADRAGLRDRLDRGKAERFGMGPTVVLGQDLADLAWPVCDGAVTDPAAGNRQVGDSHREATGT